MVTHAVEKLRDRVFRAGSWTVAGAVLSHVLRFGSNLILTRLLFPEAFGLMAILTAVLVGMTMLSDVGLSMSIVRSHRGADLSYLNTVWTMQIVKGVLVALGLWLAAGPVAAIYQEPLLAEMLPVLSVVALLSGFNSTKADLAAREVKLAAPIVIGLLAQVVGVIVMVAIALLNPTPWALLAGNVATAGVNLVASHLALPGPDNRFAWDRSVVGEVAQFGGWVMLGSAITFLAGEGAQLMRAALVDLRLLGLLGLASALSLAAWSVIRQISSRVLFPAYAEIWRLDPARHSSVVERSRRVQLGAGCLFSAVMAFAGPVIVGLLYDARYADAGLIIQIQSAGLMVSLLAATYTGVLDAMGRPGLATALLATQVVINLTGMALGAHVAGGIGVVVGGALTGWFLYPVNSWVYGRLGLWHPRTDLPVLLCALLVSLWVAVRTDWSLVAAW